MENTHETSNKKQPVTKLISSSGAYSVVYRLSKICPENSGNAHESGDKKDY
jgi:hypothetical protein